MNKVYCCFPGGKHKALTMSYDDGRTQDRRLVALFNQYGIKGTFHLNSGFLGDERHVRPDEVAALYAGHEVACHTVSHPTIARCPLPSVAREVLDDRAALEALVGYPVRGMSYPNGSVNAGIEGMLPACGIRYSRVVGNSEGFTLPENPWRWQATCHHRHHLMELGEQFRALYKRQYLYLMYVWGHSYEFDEGDGWAQIEAFCRAMGGREDTWYCTNIALMDCLDDFDRLCFAADNSFVFNPNARDCWLRVNDGEPVRVPAGETVKL